MLEDILYSKQTAFISENEVSPTKNGALNNLTFAVKDVIDIKGQQTSCGNPTWYTSHERAKNNAEIIDILLSNGGHCLGKTILGEFCTGSTGINHYYGMPINPTAPNRVPGGSSSGSASITAAGKVDFAIGTDAAGSVRVPASFCGILGIRPSYGSISMAGIKSFAPSFDTVGIFSKNIDILSRVFRLLSNKQAAYHQVEPTNFYIIQDILLNISSDYRQAIETFIKKACATLQLEPTYISLSDINPNISHPEHGINNVFKILFCTELWGALKNWIKEVDLKFSKTTYVNFERIAEISKNFREEHIEYRNSYEKSINDLLNNNNLLCIPTTPFEAPLRAREYKRVNEFEYEKLRPLISLSSIGKLPQINIPLQSNSTSPLGVSLLSKSHQDLFLIDTVKILFK